MPLASLRRRRRVRDDFNGSALRTEWAKTDSEAKLSVAGGSVVVAGGKATPAWDDPRLTYARRSWLPRAGLACEAEIVWAAFGATGCDFGFDTSNPVTDDLRPGFQVAAGGVLRAIQAQGAVARQATPVTLSLGTTYRFRVRLLDPALGVLWSFSADQGKTYTTVFVDGQYPTLGTPLWLGISNNDAVCAITYLSAGYGRALASCLSDSFAARTGPGRADTGQPWWTPNVTYAVPVIAGDMRIPAGQTQSFIVTWSGVSDGIWEGDLNFGSAPGSQKAAYLYFRYRDTSNYVRITFQRVTQQIAIVRVANGVVTTVALLSAAGWSDTTTYRMRVAAYGPVIVVYQDGVEKLRVSEEFGRYVALCGWYLNDDLPTPDLRWDTVRVWGTPARALFGDTFDRPDNATSLGVADSGQAFTPFSELSSVTPVLGIDSGRAQYVTNGPGTNDRMARTPPLPRAAYMAWALVRTTLASTGVPGLLLRCVDGQNWIAARVSYSSNQISVLKDVGGTRSTVSSTSPPALSANRDSLLVAVLVGNALDMFLDGVRYIGTTITDFPLSPVAGPYFSSLTVPRVDDLHYVALGAGGAIAHDTFTRVDSATSLGAAELPGTAWVPYGQGAGSSIWGVNTARAYQVSVAGGATSGYAVVPTLVSDVDVQVDLGATAAGAAAGLALRLVDKDNLLTVLVQGSPNNNVILRKTVAGVSTTLATSAATLADGQAHTLRAVARGSRIEVYLDGATTPLLSATETDLMTGTQHGLVASSATVGTARSFDTFTLREAT